MSQTVVPERMVGAPALIGAIASFQIGAAVAKSLFPVLGPFGTVGLRIALSMLLLCAVWRPWRNMQAQRPRALTAIVPYGLSLGMMNLCFYLALNRLPLGVVVAIEFTGPVALALAGSRRLLDLLWTALVVTGLALLLGAPASLHNLDPLGVGYGLLAGAFWAVYIVSGQRVARRVQSGPAAASGMIVASLAVVPFCIPAMAPVLHRPALLLPALLVALLSGALPYALEMAALRRMSARAYGVLASLDPAMAALSGLLLLGEHLSPMRWLAIGCIMLASAGSTMAGEAPSVSPA